MLDYAIDRTDGPVMVRTPWGRIVSRPGQYAGLDYAAAGWETVRPGDGEIAIVGVGDFLPLALAAADLLEAGGLRPAVFNPRCVSRLDSGAIDALKAYRRVITLEDCSVDGGFGQKVATALSGSRPAVSVLGLPKEFPDRFKAADLLAGLGLTPEAIAALARG